MALLINNAILHIVGTNETQFSNVELDFDSETCYEFISKHVRRLLTNPAAREATFLAESPVYGMVKAFQKGEMRFLEFSHGICEHFAGILREITDIPPADMLIVFFDYSGKSYLAMLKLNYSECFTHRVLEEDGGLDAQIIKHTSVLPISGSKVEEACLVPYDPMVLRILEKPHTVNGEEEFYFSRRFLQCESELSKKETADLIQGVSEEINARFFDDDVEMAAKIKCALMDEAEFSGEEDLVSVDNVARRVFMDNDEARTEFVSMAKEAGLPHQMKLDKSFAQRTWKTQVFKADNGIEIKFPAELYQDAETIQFVNNSDGTVSITLRNLRRHTV